MADLDHFKLLNDTHGHEAGDQALVLFARVLTETMRDEDLLCRWGGEEFTIVLPDVNLDEAIATTERVREALALALLRASAPRFTASFGVAQTDGTGNLEELVRRADQALYAAKEAGRNRTVGSPLVERAPVAGTPADGAPDEGRPVTRAAAAGDAGDHEIAGVGSATPTEGPERVPDRAVERDLLGRVE